MSYSLREALRLTSVETDRLEFIPYLLQSMTHLIQELIDFCQKKNVDITPIAAFDLKTTDWHIALCQIYEAVYAQDCERFKAGLEFQKGMRKLPKMPLSMSHVLEEFLYMLHNRRIHYPMTLRQQEKISRDDLRYIKFRLDGANARIEDRVFGPIEQPPPPKVEVEVAKPVEDEKLNRLKQMTDSRLEIYGPRNDEDDLKLRFASVGYEIMDEAPQPKMKTVTKKVVTTTVVDKKKYADMNWPYKDSYIPNAKMLQHDANLVKSSVMKEHFTSPISDKQFASRELEERHNALRMIERRFAKEMRTQKEAGK